jgi:hypothetical protein
MRPTKKKIRAEIARLRKFIDKPGSDPKATRIAYAIETALIWSIDETFDWSDMVQEAKANARLIGEEK